MDRKTNSQSIAWFADLLQSNKLDLDPPYQRGEVWSPDYKNYFIDSILNNYPVPAIFLHIETQPDGRTLYHVVDGKQRLSTIFEFIRDGFALAKSRANLYPQEPDFVGCKFSQLPPNTRKEFFQYSMPIQEVINASSPELKAAFDRLNRNVAKLTKQELRHAKYSGAFISLMDSLSDDSFWETLNILGKAKSKRMADVAFISEVFLLTMHGILDGSDQTIDEYYANYDDEIPDVEVHRRRYDECKELVIEIGEKGITKTRFRNMSDLYSLWAVLLQIVESGKSPRIATLRKGLIEFDAWLNVQLASDKPDPLAVEYGDAVRQGANKKENRITRTRILAEKLNIPMQ